VSAAMAADYQLHLLDPAVYSDARCLDGTQGGYYFRPGVGE
jgi:hypothetical protein